MGKLEDYQNDPEYWGKEDYSPTGRKAMAAGEKASKDDYVKVKGSNAGVSKSRMKAAQNAVAEDRAQQKSMSNVDEMGNAYKKGGKISSASKRADGIAIRGKTRA
jgi:hypothetical protein